MHGVFVLAGPGVKHKRNVRDLRAVDIAPTLSLLMGIPGPQNARGAILYDILKDGDGLQEVTIIDVSDWHAQLTPLAEAADNLAVNPTFSTGGAAFYKTWFDIYEAEAARSGSEVEGPGGHGWRFVRWRNASDLELLRRQTHAADHGDDGHRHRCHRQPQLRSWAGISAQRS